MLYMYVYMKQMTTKSNSCFLAIIVQNYSSLAINAKFNLFDCAFNIMFP